jgi:hypothetical protein
MAFVNSFNVHRASSVVINESGHGTTKWVNISFDNDVELSAFVGDGNELTYERFQDACASYLRSKGWTVEKPIPVTNESGEYNGA